MTDTVSATLTTWIEAKEHGMREQMLADLWVFVTTWPAARYLGGGPLVLEIMGEFDLTEEEAIAALKELGERHPRDGEANDA